MILLGKVKFCGVNFQVLLLIICAYVFTFTSQDRAVAAPPISSEPARLTKIGLSYVFIYRPAANQPTEVRADTIETAKFYEDAPVKQATIPRYVSVGNQFQDGIDNDRSHDVANFLRRPILCTSGVWSVTHVTNDVLQTMNMPSMCLAKPLYREKLRGFYGFRAKMVIRLQINATRFQQGRLLLHYLPEAVVLSPKRLSTANACLASKTQQPSIDLDCTDTEVILEVPYTNRHLYYNLLTGANAYGAFFLTVYSPLLVGTGPTTVDYSIWCHFEDVEIVYPTAALSTGPLMPQTGISGRRGKDPGVQELNGVGLGPISGIARRVSTAAGILSEIPLLSAVTAPASWVADVISRSAFALGFNKPTYQGPTQRVVLSSWSSMHNVDGVDNSLKMSLTSTNSLEHLPGFGGTDLDEMAFSFLFKISAYYTSFVWSPTNLKSSMIWNTYIRPDDFYQQVTISTNPPGVNQGVQFRPPFGYLSKMFALWRGSLNFTFKFIKTEFHSGRLMVVFTPGKQMLSSSVTWENSQYAYREILDLRSANEYTISVPFIATTPYMSVNDSAGVLSIFVLNEMRCPETVTNSVQVLVEVSAGPDFDLAQPDDANCRPCLVSQSGLGYGAYPSLDPYMVRDSSAYLIDMNMASRFEEVSEEEYDLGTLIPQGLGLDEESSKADAVIDPMPDTIGSGSVASSIIPNRMIAGEKILSVRQLIKRFGMVFKNTYDDTGSSILMRCFPISIPLVQTGTLSTFSTGRRIDMYSWIGGMYAFHRGGQRIKFISNVTEANVLTASIRYYDTLGGADMVSVIGPTPFDHEPTAVGVEQLAKFSGGLELEVPYGTYTHLRYNAYSDHGVSFNASEGGLALILNQSVVGNQQHRIYRAAADDFSFGFFIGCPATFNGPPVFA